MRRSASLRANQENNEKGFLQIRVVSDNNEIPIKNARIEIASTGNPDQTLEQIRTNGDGLTETIELSAPPLEYSLSPSDNQPYSEYNLKVSADHYEDTIISGVQILSGEIGLQNIRLLVSRPISPSSSAVIPFGNTILPRSQKLRSSH